MLFNSLEFLCFLPIVFLLYWIVPKKVKIYILLVASLWFYMSWSPKCVILLLLSAGISFLTVHGFTKTKHKKIVFVTGIILILAILIVFKYSGFIFDSLNSICTFFAIPLSPFTVKLVLPMGISFYTFQTLSYCLDVYRGKIQPERNFILYLTFISFFPQLVAGPIERAEDLLPQLKADRSFLPEMAYDGIKQILVGYYKKLVLADFFGKYVDLIYDSIYGKEGLAYICAAVFLVFRFIVILADIQILRLVYPSYFLLN